MFYIATTRFNNETYEANKSYRKTNSMPVIYGTSIKIQDKYVLGSLMFVIEMNNEQNRIEGIGLIRNTIITDKRHIIYSNNDYNRFIYHGDYWLSRNQLEEYDAELVEICDLVLFKGKSHLKRQSGISVLTAQLFTNWDYSLSKMKEKIRKAFISAFKSDNYINSETGLKNTLIIE
jgi:phage pi2 protein 07